MMQPGWDGRGDDPWLPQRLNARLEAAAHEKAIRAEYLRELGTWLAGTSARVLSSAAPNPDAVFARAPAWSEAMRALTQGRIADAVGVAFRRLFGMGFDWRERPFVRRYLDEVHNRLTRLPDEVYDLITGQLKTGINAGEGVPLLAARIDRELMAASAERWPNRATVVARTEAIGALNAGRHDAFVALGEDLGEPLEQVWLSADDSRTRPTHDAADGQRVPLGGTFIVGGFELRFPGDPLGPPQEVIQCRCTSLIVEPGEWTDLSNRQYRG